LCLAIAIGISAVGVIVIGDPVTIVTGPDPVPVSTPRPAPTTAPTQPVPTPTAQPNSCRKAASEGWTLLLTDRAHIAQRHAPWAYKDVEPPLNSIFNWDTWNQLDYWIGQTLLTATRIELQTNRRCRFELDHPTSGGVFGEDPFSNDAHSMAAIFDPSSHLVISAFPCWEPIAARPDCISAEHEIF
jgi:hypothetical protein